MIPPSKTKEYMAAYRDAHRDRIREQARACYARSREKKLAKVKAAYDPTKEKAKHDKDPRRRMVVTAKHRSKLRGLPFNLKIEDFEIPKVCPVLGIPLSLRSGLDNTPQLDRLIPSLGYVRGNVAVISGRANRIKNDATSEELFKLSTWVLGSITSRVINNE